MFAISLAIKLLQPFCFDDVFAIQTCPEPRSPLHRPNCVVRLLILYQEGNIGSEQIEAAPRVGQPDAKAEIKSPGSKEMVDNLFGHTA